MINGQTGPFYDATKASELVGAVSNSTLSRWMHKGRTPWGLNLKIIRHPLARTGNHKPRSDKQFRLLLAEDDIFLLRDVLRACRKNPGARVRLTSHEIAGLRAATRRARFPLRAASAQRLRITPERHNCANLQVPKQCRFPFTDVKSKLLR